MSLSATPVLPGEVTDLQPEPTDLDTSAAILYVNQEIKRLFFDGQARVKMTDFDTAMQRRIVTLFTETPEWVIEQATVQVTPSALPDVYFLFTKPPVV